MLLINFYEDFMSKEEAESLDELNRCIADRWLCVRHTLDPSAVLDLMSYAGEGDRDDMVRPAFGREWAQFLEVRKDYQALRARV